MINSDPTNIPERVSRGGRKKGALGLSVKRLDAWPEWFKGIVRYCIVAGETLEEAKRRCQQMARTMRVPMPTMSDADWKWFGETDPAILATLEECGREQEDRGHHPLSSKAAGVEFLIQRVEQLDEWRVGLTSLTTKEWCQITNAQLKVVQRIGSLVDRQSSDATGAWEKQSWISELARRSDRLPGDETAYAEDRDRLDLPSTPSNQVAGGVFLPISHLRILQDLERSFPHEAAILIDELMRSNSPEDGLWALPDRWWVSRADSPPETGIDIVNDTDAAKSAQELRGPVPRSEPIGKPVTVARRNPVPPPESDGRTTVDEQREKDGAERVEETAVEVTPAGATSAQGLDGLPDDGAAGETSAYISGKSNAFFSPGELAALAELGRYKCPEYAHHSRYLPIGWNDLYDQEEWNGLDEGDLTTRKPVDLVVFT